jgi:hypothetical protein
MRKISIDIPSDYCNDCIFYSTRMPDPEECTGFGGFRRYWCILFKVELNPNSIVHKKRRHMWEDDEKKVIICDQCKNKYSYNRTL